MMTSRDCRVALLVNLIPPHRGCTELVILLMPTFEDEWGTGHRPRGALGLA